MHSNWPAESRMVIRRNGEVCQHGRIMPKGVFDCDCEAKETGAKPGLTLEALVALAEKRRT